MANLTTVDLTNGIPSAGTGTVMTLNSIAADGGIVTIGAQADAASATTTISAKLRGIATALGITALDLGSGTGGSRTLRFFLDTAQWIGGSGANGTAVQRVCLATDSPGVTTLGNTTMASSLPVTMASNQAAIPCGLGARVSVTRPSNTNTYGAGDVVGVTGGGTASITFALGAVSGSHILITSVSLQRNATALISGEAGYTLHLFNVTQPGAQVDEDTFTVAAGDQASYLGSIAISTPVDMGATLEICMPNVNKQVKLAGTSIFGVLVTTGSYTAASAAVHVVTLNAIQL